MSGERWLEHVGRGPARDACERAVRQFADAFAGGDVDATPGFAWEGLAAGLVVSENEERLILEFERATPAQQLFLQVGCGFARGVLGQPPRSALEADGVGFSVGLLQPRRALDRGTRQVLDSGVFERWHDHGLGRSIWYVTAGNARTIGRLVRRLDPSRRPALWRGVGVACAFTGGAGPQEVARLVVGCDDLRALREGVSWAHGLRPIPDGELARLLPDGPLEPSDLYLEVPLGESLWSL